MLHSIKVSDYMTHQVITLSPDTDVMMAIKIFLEANISGAPVVDHLGEIVGLLSEKDCMAVAAKQGYYGEAGGKVSEFMTTSVTTVESDASVLDVAKMFLDKPYKRYPVIEDNELVGQISRRDVLKAIHKIHESVW